MRELHKGDLRDGHGEVQFPEALARNVLPSGRRSVDPRSGATRRHHLHETSLQEAVARAAKDAGISN